MRRPLPLELYSKAELHLASVSESTRRTYESRLNSMRAQGLEIGYEGLETLIRAKDGAKARSLRVTRSAVSWCLKCRGQEPLTAAQNGELDSLLRGRRRLMGATPPKGAIDLRLVGELIDYTREVAGYTAGDRRNIRIAWGTGLRDNQLETLRRRHFVKVRKVWRMRIEEQHKPNAGDRDAPVMRDAAVHPALNFYLDAWLPTLAADDLVCPGWSGVRYGRLVKAAAEHCGWDPRLAWKGVHQLRHGAAVDLARREGDEAAAELLGHTVRKPTLAMTRHYARSNKARVARGSRKAPAAPGAARARKK